MNELYQQAIELRYQGLTYKQISQAIGGQLTDNTLETYFATKGILFSEYQKYCDEQSKVRRNETRTKLQEKLPELLSDYLQVLQTAKKEKKWGLVVTIIQDLFNRGGLPIATRNEIDKGEEKQSDFKTYEQFTKFCEQYGIDPDTGLPRRSLSVEKSTTIRTQLS